MAMPIHCSTFLKGARENNKNIFPDIESLCSSILVKYISIILPQP